MDVTWIGMLAAMGGSSTPVNTWVFLASAVALYAMGAALIFGLRLLLAKGWVNFAHKKGSN